MTRLYAEVIGDPIAHSKSPLIHNFWLAEAGIDADYRRCHVTPDELPAYIEARRADPGWRGCNVTIPHKRAVLGLLDAVDPLAARIGAVNTIVRGADGRLTGHNTDAAGFMEALQPDLARPSLLKMARLIGTGGAARAIAHALKDAGFLVVILGRDLDKARALLAEIGESDETLAAPLGTLATPSDFVWDDRGGVLDLVVNATSLGMTGYPPLPLDPTHLPPGAIVYDVVYAPLETELLATARAGGHRTIDGLSMLVGQAAEAFALFFGTPAPRGRDPELRALLKA
ncbi:shikimate dehydrogenase [Sphingomonas naphthae]|uniref:Shikimate dehydrogenase (NADP(+)) n=1 Tax=Sphingomonas naphthae TaxID=1813468 RepID=A0ABY7TK24_9SPHN|nr:shikimate dehydrogenase [Sphingomonas naphthae]WCT73283.1 shikimate dehydrogenase [Sphingomonas naphthae]